MSDTSSHWSARELARSVDWAHEAVIGVAPDGSICAWSRGAERLFEFRAGEVIGKAVSWLWLNDRDGFAALLESSKRSLKVERIDSVWRSRSGRAVPVRVSLIPTLDVNGSPDSITMVATRREGQEREAPSDRLLAAIVESSEDAIYSKSLNGIIMTWNRSAERLYGYLADEAIGQHISLLAGPGQEDEVAGIIERIKLGQRVDHFATTHRRKDGQPIHVSVAVSPICDDNGEIVGAAAIARDVSSTTRLKEKQDDFIAALSHDLKNPLIGMDRLVGILLGETLPPQHRDEILTHLKSATEGMLRLVWNVLDTYRCQSESFEPARERIRIRDVVESCLKDMELPAHMKGITLERDYIEEQPLWVDTDFHLMRRVLINLVDNALKFTHTAGNVIVRMQRAGDWVVIQVCDNGVGIASDYLPRLFERFYQTEQGKQYHTGTGLGLYLCRRIVEAHGGAIQCSSEEGRGTTFTILLPPGQ